MASQLTAISTRQPATGADSEYHSSEHVVSRGVRVELTPHCRSTLDGMFNGNAEGDTFPVDRCVQCNRKITKGDFALEHQMFAEKAPAGEEKSDETQLRVKKVRTIPRMWCFECSIKNAKQQRVGRPTNIPIVPMLEKWEETMVQLQEDGSGAKADIRNNPVAGVSGGGGGGGGFGGGPGGDPANRDDDVAIGVRVVQCEHPEYGAKRVAAELRTRLQMTVSDKRVKKFMTPSLMFQNGVICRVGAVFDGSPAAVAGLQENDNIVVLGLLDGKMYKSVGESIVPLISSSIGTPVIATVLRNSADGPLTLTLVPRKWSGGGVLGCKLVGSEDFSD